MRSISLHSLRGSCKSPLADAPLTAARRYSTSAYAHAPVSYKRQAKRFSWGTGATMCNPGVWTVIDSCRGMSWFKLTNKNKKNLVSSSQPCRNQVRLDLILYLLVIHGVTLDGLFFFPFFPLMSNALKPTTLGLRALSSLAVYLSSTVK